ncbi:MAG: glycine cleavage system protein GcvH [Actinomycetales bacterium]|nr:glycine cleavage system protein GcvH [Actinomycetales bacterium]
MAEIAVPGDLHYTRDHEWVRVEGDLVRMGITDFAQDALGDVVYVNLPAPGSRVSAGTACGEVESTKSVSDVFAPLDGTVVETNPQLGTAPELVNSDAYGQGWMILLRPDAPAAVEGLIDADGYRAMLG